MRIRYIKPGILANEDIAELGPYAYILFTGLWMYADREGRFELRPRRIKATVMPMWDGCSVADVERLIGALAERGMLQVYESRTQARPEPHLGTARDAPENGSDPVVASSRRPQIVQITNWEKHQKPHHRETTSVLPPPPSGKVPRDSHLHKAAPRHGSGRTQARPEHDQGTEEPGGEWGMGNGEEKRRLSFTRGFSGMSRLTSSPVSPVAGSSERTQKRKTPPPEKLREYTPPDFGELVAPPPEKPPEPERKNPAVATEPGSKSGAALSKYSPEDVKTVRDSLQQLAPLIHLPPPDDGIVLRLLASGATGDVIHATLCALYKSRRFAQVHSWGLIPLALNSALAS